jgi:hypothetical protein
MVFLHMLLPALELIKFKIINSRIMQSVLKEVLADKLKQANDHISYLEMELEGESRTKKGLAELVGVGDEPRWKWILIAVQNYVIEHTKFKKMVDESQTFGMESIGWRKFDGEGGYDSYWNKDDLPVHSSLSSLFPLEEMFIKTNEVVSTDQVKESALVRDLKEQLAGWEELYDHVARDFDKGIFPARYDNPKTRAVAQRLYDNSKIIPAGIVTGSTVQWLPGSNTIPDRSTLYTKG